MNGFKGIKDFLHGADKFVVTAEYLWAFFFGFVAIACSFVVETYVMPKTTTDQFLGGLYINFISIAFTEELFKWIAIKGIGDRRVRDPYDYMIIALFVNLAFTIVEDLMYTMGDPTIMMQRMVSLPVHFVAGMYAARFMGKKRTRMNAFMSIFVPTVLHGIWDYMTFLERVHLMGDMKILSIIGFVLFLYLIFLYDKAFRDLKNYQKEYIERRFPGGIREKCVIPEALRVA